VPSANYTDDDYELGPEWDPYVPACGCASGQAVVGAHADLSCVIAMCFECGKSVVTDFKDFPKILLEELDRLVAEHELKHPVARA
jgi:hypothetical protein